MSEGQFIPIHWGAPTAAARGPIISRDGGGYKKNVIGHRDGPNAIMYEIAIALGQVTRPHNPILGRSSYIPLPRPSSEEAAALREHAPTFDPTKIFSFDPFGYRVEEYFGDLIVAGASIMPNISVTMDEQRIDLVERYVAEGRLSPDNVVIRKDARSGDVTALCRKISFQPVWHLPQVAKAIGLTEEKLRQALYAATNNPDLINRKDLDVYLPPIQGHTFYVMGDIRNLRNPNTKLALRVHDACGNGDTHNSTRCTCHASMEHAKAEGAALAQQGDVFVLAYRSCHEGRGLGELVKVLVYAARGAGDRPDTFDNYFPETMRIAGVIDVRLHQLTSDMLRFLGRDTIDVHFTMSPHKGGGIAADGMLVKETVPLPPELIALRSWVEMLGKTGLDAYLTNGIDYKAAALAAGYREGLDLPDLFEGVPTLHPPQNTFNLARCALTGADSDVKIAELNELSARFPFAEIALLWDPDAAGTSRNPSREWIGRFIETYQGQRAMHLCNRGLFEFVAGAGETMAYLPHFPRIQLNLRYDKAPGNYDPAKLVERIKQHPNHEFILQLGEEEKALLPMLKDLSNVSVFYDTSAGSGVKASVYQPPIDGFKTGYAGGLNPDNLAEEIRRIRMTAPNATTWVDAESGLRTRNKFDMVKARRFLAVAETFVTIENRRTPAQRTQPSAILNIAAG